MKKYIITIAGNNGGGKSSASSGTALVLGYEKKSTGDFMRSMAEKRGITLNELSERAETDPLIDKELDDYNLEIGKKKDIVLDSRLGFYFIPEAFKVFLYCDAKTAAKRIMEDAKVNASRHNESRQGFDTVEKIVESITRRLESERKRYKELYGIEDHTSPAHYDLVIDNTLPENTKERVPQIISDAYKKWLKE